MTQTGGQLASVIGRYYAMDRDKRWERIKQCYDLLVHGKGEASDNFIESIKASYERGVTDEFIKPLFKENSTGNSLTKIESGDVVIFLNFRTDRGRELTQALSQKAFPNHDMEPLSLRYVTLTNYDESFIGVDVIFDKHNLNIHLFHHVFLAILAHNIA